MIIHLHLTISPSLFLSSCFPYLPLREGTSEFSFLSGSNPSIGTKTARNAKCWVITYVSDIFLIWYRWSHNSRRWGCGKLHRASTQNNQPKYARGDYFVLAQRYHNRVLVLDCNSISVRKIFLLHNTCAPRSWLFIIPFLIFFVEDMILPFSIKRKLNLHNDSPKTTLRVKTSFIPLTRRWKVLKRTWATLHSH